MKTTIIAALGAALATTAANATLVNVGFDLSGSGAVAVGGTPTDTLTVAPKTGSFSIQDDGNPYDVTLSSYIWKYVKVKSAGSATVTDTLTIDGQSHTFNQGLHLTVINGKKGQNQSLVLDGTGADVADFTWTTGGKSYDLQVILNGFSQPVSGTFPVPGSVGPAPFDATATLNVTAVPEPSTLVAGGLLLLPFGMSMVRSIRRNRP